jgi:hypothetical protein
MVRFAVSSCSRCAPLGGSDDNQTAVLRMRAQWEANLPPCVIRGSECLEEPLKWHAWTDHSAYEM